MLLERAWVLPVVETQDVGLVWTTTEENDNTDNDQPDNKENLQRGEPELGLTVVFHSGKVQHNNQGQHDDDPDPDWHFVGPVFNNNGGSGDFRTNQDQEGVNVDSSSGKPE
ncbi:hypothetical protein WICPIJ_002933 [Wickerhamomyces pijperi]|uniref:Uncharacterized protein n=1 Tax=Wickerhamomyces pijperi TaxID=599730 RepID=A0A9P8Q8V0_WICPI|nr:hypothetical protein WICPIJ_002933 [Wickerhamomyces pijperi]